MAIKVQGTTVIDDSRQLSVTGISTLGSVKVDSGIVTSVSGVVTYFGDGSNLTDLTGASVGTYGSNNVAPIITVDANGRITGITTASISGTDAIASVSEDTNPQLGGNLDLNSKLINGTGGINITGVATATAFHTGAEGSAVRITSNTISGPAELFIDPAAVGDDTGAVRIKGDLYVDGTTTQINSTTIQLADFIVGIATTATTDLLADGAGITIGPNNSLLYDHTNTALKSSENLNLATGKTYKINGTDVLSATTLESNVVNSSLTSVGTLVKLNVTGIVTATSFDGDLTGNADTATEATNVNLLTNDSTNETVYLTFADGQSGSQRLETDISLTYNPSTNIIGATADNANNVNLLANNTNDETVYLTFADGATGSQRLETDTNLTYNPSTNIIGARSSESSLAYNVNLNANNSNNETVYLTFADGATGTQALETDTALTYNPSTNVIGARSSESTHSYGLKLTANSDNSNYLIPFSDLTSSPGTTHTNSDIHVDTALSYNPSTNTLNAAATTSNHSYGLKLTANSDNVNYLIPFSSLSSSPGTTHTNSDVYTDTGLTYNPSTNTLNAAATTSNHSFGLKLTANSDNSNYLIPFSSLTSSPGTTHTNSDVYTDTGLTYNPYTNTLNAAATTSNHSFGLKLTANSDNSNYLIPFSSLTSSPGTNHTNSDVYTDTGLTYNPSTNTLNTTVDIANNVNLLANNTNNETVYLTFADGATGSQRLETDTGLTYNPSTNILNTTVDFLNLAINNITDETVYLTFADGQNGSQRLETDSSLTYNPSTNTISGTISNAIESTNVNLLANNTNDETVYLTFADGATGSQRLETDTNLTYNPSANLLTTTVTSISLASNVSTDETVYLTFADGQSGSQTLETDNTLNYNPSTNTLTAGTFSGSGSSLTGLTGASAATYGSSDIAPVITVDANGRITGITTAPISGSGAIASIVEDTTPQLGGNLDLNSNDITGTGNVNITGIITATTFSGSGASLTSIPNSALDNSSVNFGGVTLSLGQSDTTPAFDLSDATNYPYTSLTGIATHIVGDTTPQLGGNLDLNSNDITGTGNINVTGIITATSFVKSGGTSSQFLKADGSVDSSTYLTSYAETDTLDSVVGRGNTTSNNIQVGILTATALHTGAEGSAIRVTSNTISGPAELFIDPAAVGDDTGAVRIKGDLYVDGTTTQINSTTIELADFIVGIATTATSDLLADGAGITIGPDNTLLYDHSNTSLKSSENLNLATGKTYKINGTDVLSATTLGSNVVNSSLTSVGTLTELNVSGISTLTNQAEVRSDDGSQGRIDFYCEVSNAHYTRLQAAAHADYSGNATVTLPSSSGTLLLTNGSGANLTSLNASNLGSGTVPDARFPSTLPTVSGANLTSLNASNLGSGTVPDDRFPSTLPAVSGANLTNLTGVGVGTYGSASLTPIITVDSNGRITSISTVTSTGSGGISNVVEDTTPQLGGNLDLNSKLIDGTGGINITGVATATGFATATGTSSQFLKADGSVDSSTYLTSFTETNDLSSAVTWANVPNANITESSVTQHQAALSITESQISDLQSYLTSYTETQTLDDVVGLGSATTQTITVGTATTGVVIRPDGTLNVTGIATATTFSGSGASLTSIPNSALDNSSVNFGGVTLSLGQSDTTPAFDLSDATNYPFTSLTGIVTHIVGDTTPQLGGNLDLNSNDITGTGDVNITGVITATSFSGSASNMTGLTGASAGSYGSTGLTPVITVDANGRITGITTVTTAGSGGGLAQVSDDTTPQLGGDLDLNSNDITGTGNMNVTGIITATSFSGNIISESSVPNSALVNTTIYLGGVNIALGATDATPAFDLTDATNYPFTSLTGIVTHIVGDTTPQLGGDLDLNANLINGTGGINISGIITGTTFSGSGASLTSIPAGQLTGTVADARLSTVSSSKLSGALPALDGSALTDLTGASAATYGSANATPVIVVDSNGRITGISTVATAGSGSGSGISSISEDTTPQLGGTLDTNGNLIQFGDSSGSTDDRLRFGAGNDLQIYHDGSDSYVSQQSDVGDLYIVSLNDDNDVIIQTDDGSGNTTDYFRADGSTGEAKLFYYGSEKIKTVTTGVTITGTASATSFSGSGSSLTGLTGASAATYGSSTVTPIITVDSSGRITGITTAATAGGGGGGGSGTVTGVSSDGEIVGTGVTTINFVGTGITVSITGGQADITIPTSDKNVHREVATEGQTVVPASGTVEYTVGHCDVYLNGSKLDSTEYTATNGTSITLTTGASVGDIIEVVGFQIGVELNLVGLSDVVDDTSPQLGGNLDLNSRLIQGTGGINITGIATATSFSGSGANLTGIPNSALDNSTISVGGVTFNLGGTDTTPAFNLSDATNYPYTSLTGISTDIVGDTTPQLGGNLDLNSKNITGTGNMNVTGIITATSFTGNITGNVVGDVTGNVTGNVTGTATTATNVTVADESSDTTCFPLFATAATGNLPPKSGSNLTFNSSAGILGATTFQGNLDVAGLLKEGVNIVTGKLSDNTNIDLANGMVHYFDTVESTTSTPNIRVDASTTLNSSMNVGEAITVVLISSAAAAGYSAQLTIDGAAVTEKWLGGSAPSTGGSSGVDVYTYNIIKYSSTPIWSVLANVVNFA